ncbi:hypothetical protein CROQUDRAFT_39343, partial [Cronartium quercuum f. sp. fusiforme G11]
QCFRCWYVGHMAKWCQNTPLCCSCCGDHDTLGCMAFNLTILSNCCLCIWRDKNPAKRVDMDAPQFDH